LKTQLAISALFTAAVFLTPAQATSIVFNSSPSTVYGTSQGFSLGSGLGSVVAYGFDGVFSVTTPPLTVSVNSGSADSVVLSNPGSQSNPSGPADIEVSKHGLGLSSNDPKYIGPTDGVVLDFSQVVADATTQTGSVSQISFNMTVDIPGSSYWTVYGYNTTGVNAGKYALLSSGPMASGATPSFTSTSSTLYSDYLVGVTNDCGLTINSVDVAYSGGTGTQQTPEPGTFVMAGMALIGAGVTMRKRNRKA
jgi:hypothetical protein